MTESAEIDTVAVIGAGTMGPGMSAMFAAHGYETRLMDIKPEVLKAAKESVEAVFTTLVKEGFLSEEQATGGRDRLTFTPDQAEAVNEADFVVEAIPERFEIKRDFYREVENQVGREMILASNTSGIPISKLCDVCQHPTRVVGMHWSNPPHIIPVIEVIRGNQTSDRTVGATKQIIDRLGMVAVEVRRDVPGFVENRILYAIMREALHLLEEGVATAEDIDTVTRWGIGYKLSVIGPLELLDVAGLDIYDSVASYLNEALSDEKGVSEVIRERVERNDLGFKTGKGLFDYEEGEIPRLMERRIGKLLDVKKALTDE